MIWMKFYINEYNNHKGKKKSVVCFKGKQKVKHTQLKGLLFSKIDSKFFLKFAQKRDLQLLSYIINAITRTSQFFSIKSPASYWEQMMSCYIETQFFKEQCGVLNRDFERTHPIVLAKLHFISSLLVRFRQMFSNILLLFPDLP